MGRTQGLERASVSADSQLVVFRVGSGKFAVNIHDVREIIRLPRITRVPEASEVVEGIINLRDEVIPVYDLRKRFGVSETGFTEESRIIVVNVRELCGLIVDAVQEVISVSKEAIVPPPPEVVTQDSSYIDSIAIRDDRLILILNLKELLQGVTAAA